MNRPETEPEYMVAWDETALTAKAQSFLHRNSLEAKAELELLSKELAISVDILRRIQGELARLAQLLPVLE